MRKTKESGITLIALIITIIVMLILVGVTVAVALNGGLFSTTKKAATDTQLEADRETLQAAVVGAINKDSLTIEKRADLKTNLPSVWIVTGNDGGPYKATSPKGNKFTVENDGTIYDPGVAIIPSELEEYILGTDRNGRNAEEIFFSSVGQWYFKENSLGLEVVERNVISLSSVEMIEDYYTEYKGKLYKFRIISNSNIANTDSEEGMKLVYEAEEGTKVGKYVQYDGKNWIVLYDDNTNGLQMISENVLEVNNVYLGYRDPTIEESKVEDIDGDGKKSNFEKAIYSYNNAIRTLNNKCESLVTPKAGAIKGVRSVGSNPTNKNNENKTPYASEKIKQFADEIWNNKGYSSDDNYISDYERLLALGITNKLKNNNLNCWMASRIVYDFNENSISFGMRMLSGSSGYLWEVGEDNRLIYDPHYGTQYGGVLPVIMLENGALDGLTGEGTAENPWILE